MSTSETLSGAMSFEEWHATGVREGWCSDIVCGTHDMTPMDDDEEDRFDSGEDPCVGIVRIW